MTLLDKARELTPPRKQVVSIDEKLEVVLAYMEGTISRPAAVAVLNIAYTNLASCCGSTLLKAIRGGKVRLVRGGE